MSTSDPVGERMEHWEAARQQGKKLTPTELCADCPELLEEVRNRIRAVLAMEEILGVTNHDPQRTMAAPMEILADDRRTEPLPNIPGYEIIRMVDEGGMGVIYEARQLALGRTVAIKMISGVRLRPKLLARFQAEVEAAARLQHPNFVQIFEVDQINGRPFFSMEYVAGGTLAESLARTPLSARRSAELIETLARAIHAAHECGIVHRDLKPANVMLTADGIPKIADFGLAKRLDDDSDHTRTGEILGTPSYMAPEQAEGKKDLIGPATDIYALGTILYEMLAGKPPFQGGSPLDSLRRVLVEEPTPPSQIAPRVPRDLEAICLKCLEKAPRQRYASAHALAEDLRRFLNGQPVTARHIGPVQRAGKWIRRHPQAAALGATLGLLALVPISWLVAQLHARRQADLQAEETQRQIRLRAQEQAPLVREILHRNCHECHGQDPSNREKNLDILNHKQLLDSARRIVVPGSPRDSRLIHRIADGSMPPEEEEIRLPRVTEKELTILETWILGGAPPLPTTDPVLPVNSAAPYSELAARTKTILLERCYECHKYDVAKGGIKILHHRLLLTARNGKVVVPGRPEESELYQLLTTADDDIRMPPKTGKRLSEVEIDTIRQWIEEGAAPFPKAE